MAEVIDSSDLRKCYMCAERVNKTESRRHGMRRKCHAGKVTSLMFGAFAVLKGSVSSSHNDRRC